MPAFGYMLLLNDNVQQYLTIKFDGWLLNYLPSLWRIYLLFYGSFLLAAATIIYSLVCGNDIKNYASAYELADAQAEHLFRLGKWQQVFSTVKKLQDGMSRWERSIFDLAPFEYPPGLLATTPEVSSALIYIWRIQNIKHPRLRIVLLCMYAVGLLLIAVPAVVTLVQVTYRLFVR